MVLTILQIFKRKQKTPPPESHSPACILEACNFIKKDILRQAFFCEFCRHLFCGTSANSCFLKTETSCVTTPSGASRKFDFFSVKKSQFCHNIVSYIVATFHHVISCFSCVLQFLSQIFIFTQDCTLYFKKFYRRMEVFLWIQLTAFGRQLFPQINSIADVQLDSRYASGNKCGNLSKTFVLILFLRLSKIKVCI